MSLTSCRRSWYSDFLKTDKLSFIKSYWPFSYANMNCLFPELLILHLDIFFSKHPQDRVKTLAVFMVIFTSFLNFIFFCFVAGKSDLVHNKELYITYFN